MIATGTVLQAGCLVGQKELESAQEADEETAAAAAAEQAMQRVSAVSVLRQVAAP
jgi:hypothetical protein